MDYSGFQQHEVLCVDMRSFYASVECVKRGLDPMTTLLAVVGDTKRPGSIVLAASPALKKKHGVSNVSRYFELPEDPEIVIAEAHMKDYLEVSVAITELVHEYVPMEAIHVYSVDEFWVTLDGTEKLHGTAEETAAKLQADILEQFGVTAAIGIGDNKFLAKVVMDIHAKKQTSGIAICHYQDVSRLLWPVPIQDIWGIGRRMQRNLNRMGIVTLGHLAHTSLEQLKKRYGVMGEQLYWHAWGIDESEVLGDFVKQEQKSYGHGITLLRNYRGEEIPTIILELCEEACRRARRDRKEGNTVHLAVGYASQHGGGFSRSRSFTSPSNLTTDMYKLCLELFHEHYQKGHEVRRVSVSLTNLYDEEATQLSLFEDKSKQKDLSRTMDQIRARFGTTAILRASSHTAAGMTIERSTKIGGHQA